MTLQCAKSEGIGIDLGIKSFAVLSDGRNYPNINKTQIAKMKVFARYALELAIIIRRNIHIFTETKPESP